MADSKKLNTDKEPPKGNIKYNISLNEEQKHAKAGVYSKSVTVVTGPAASGKTQFAVLTALDLFFKREVDKIIISRPAHHKMGYLPGSTDEKMQPHIQPIKQCMYEATKAQKIDSMFADKSIQILPIDYMKGVTFKNAVIIIDEFQDMDYDSFKLVLTRLGKTSKLIFIGSEDQVDETMKNTTCIKKVMKLREFDLVNFHTFSANHRNEDIFKIIKFMEK